MLIAKRRAGEHVVCSDGTTIAVTAITARHAVVEVTPAGGRAYGVRLRYDERPQDLDGITVDAQPVSGRVVKLAVSASGRDLWRGELAPAHDIAENIDDTTAWYLDRQRARMHAHDGRLLREAARAPGGQLGDEPTALLAMSAEACAVAAGCAVLRDRHTWWEQVRFGVPIDAPTDYRLVFVAAGELGAGMADSIRDEFPGIEVIDGLCESLNDETAIA